jgi:hypothetical protein
MAASLFTPAAAVPTKQADVPLLLISTLDAAGATGVANLTVDATAGVGSMQREACCGGGGGGGGGVGVGAGAGAGAGGLSPPLPPPQAANEANTTQAPINRKRARRDGDEGCDFMERSLWVRRGASGEAG